MRIDKRRAVGGLNEEARIEQQPIDGREGAVVWREGDVKPIAEDAATC